MRTVEEMKAKNVWGEHPLYTREAWAYDASERNTNSGYWEWVQEWLDAESKFKGEA